MAGWATSETAMSAVPEPTHDLLGSLFMGDPDSTLDTILNDLSTYDHEN
jgi:hypothetical protein